MTCDQDMIACSKAAINCIQQRARSVCGSLGVLGCPHFSAGVDKMGREGLQDEGKTLESASPEGSARAELQEGEK